MIKINNLYKNYNDVKAVKGISIEINSGEMFGLIGPDGAGKTTIIRILCGLLNPTSGEAFLMDKNVQTERSHIQKSIGYLSQLFSLYGDLTVDENIIRQKRKERIKNKIKEKVYNPEYDKVIESGKVSYIQNINTIEFILTEPKPTKEQVIFVLALIDSDVSYEQAFYKRLTKVGWFEILKRKGVFKAENNPAPFRIKDGPQVPLWEPLVYLQRLSFQIKDGQHLELIDDIIAIITSISWIALAMPTSLPAASSCALRLWI